MGKYGISRWLVCLLCLFSFAVQAQSTVLYFNEPPKETLGRNKNQLVINRFFNDRDDFLWFISSNGLSRYDGHEAVVKIRSDPADLNSLSSPSAVDMVQDDRGIFWITTRDNGLNAYNPQTGNVTHFRHQPTNKSSLSTDKLRFLQRDESGHLWIGSDLGMNDFDPKTGRTVRFLPKPGQAGQLQGNPLSPIMVDRSSGRSGVPGESHVYVSTTAGLEQYDRTRKQWRCWPVTDKNGVSPSSPVGFNITRSLCKDHTGRLWMGIPDQTGLRVFDPKTGQLTAFDTRTADGKSIPFPKVILEDKSGRLWLCCENEIFRISADRRMVEQCTPIAVENQERLTGLVTLYEDRQGLIWLERIDDKNPLFFDPRQERYPNLTMPQVGNTKPLTNDIFPDTIGLTRPGLAWPGLIWISTNLGLIRHDPGRGDTRFVLKLPNVYSSIPLPDVTGLPGHQSGRHLLLISEDEGLFIFDKKMGRTTPVKLNKVGGKSIQTPIFSVLDKDSDLWVSTWGYGLFRIPAGNLSVKTGIVTTYEQWKNDPTNANSLPSNTLQKIAVDAENTVWVCGAATGLCRVNKRTRQVQRFMLRQGDPTGIASNYTYAPLIDNQGNVWVTSGYNAPLQKLSVKTGRFKKYGIANGFTDDYFAHAILDGTGKIWFNQNQVVSCIDPITETVTTIPQFVGRSVYATPITVHPTTGEIYFSCQNNLRRFKPASVLNNPRTTSPLRLVAVSCFDTDVTKTMKPLPPDRWQSNDLTLSYRENTLEFKFALLDYRNTASREYAYALTGTTGEPQWVSIGQKNTVDFAQITPGTYLFHLKARNSDGVWTALSAPLRIRISPPWWLSPGAYVAYALLLLLVFWYLIRVRLRDQARKLALAEAVVIKQQRDEITRKNAQNELLLKEIHHRVKNNLEVVASLLALQADKVTDPNVQKAMQDSQNRVQSMGIIHQKLYQSKQLAAIEMRDYFVNLGESVLDSFDAAGRITIECPMPELVLDIDTAIPVGLVTNELLTNALKYAFLGKDTGTIRISLTHGSPLGSNNDSFLLQVADNGTGKPPGDPAKGTGFGTHLIDLLTQQLGGTLTYENQNGTVVSLLFTR